MSKNGVMKFFTDERVGAVFMLLAACAGFGAINFGMFESAVFDFRNVCWPWVSQVGMGLFFALIGFEIRNEFAAGLFRNPRAILVPALAALVGVIVPAATYLAIAFWSSASSSIVSGWPMVTATDVSFALMAFSLLARGLPSTLRAFLLSFAVIDDILATIALALGFWRVDALTPLAATSIAMVLAFSLDAKRVKAVISFLSPFVAFVVLPVFAFFAMQIRFEPALLFAGSGSLLAILFLSRPIAKWIGVYLGAIAGNRLVGQEARLPLTRVHFLRVSSLAGIGFTVSLLAADLTFGSGSALFATAATMTVVASLLAAALAAIALKVRRASK